MPKRHCGQEDQEGKDVAKGSVGCCSLAEADLSVGPNWETGLRDGESLGQRSSVKISLSMVWGQSYPNSPSQAMMTWWSW